MPTTARSAHTARRRLTGLAAVTTVAATMAATMAVAPAGATAEGATESSPGARGIGDPYYPYYGNGGYDVGHYRVAVAYDPDTLRLSGRTTVRATATQDLSRFDLDMLLRVRSVRVDGQVAQFEQRGVQELVVTPPSDIAADQTFRTTVRYAGVPSRIEGPGSIQTWVTTPDGAVAIGEPEIAAWWYPSNDHPRDPALFDVDITVPRGLQAVSNGARTARRDNGDGTRTWSWHSSSPMATYLAFMAIGRYDIEQGTDRGGRPYLYAFSKLLDDRTAANARAAVRSTAWITRFEEAQFGPYPFDQVGGVVPGGEFGYALENQTRPVHSPFFFDDSRSRFVIAHEQAHQWYGDNVTVHNWRDIWLNEGFASYAEYLYAQRRFGVAPQRTFTQSYEDIGRFNEFWDLRIGNPGAHNEFAGPVYDRGAMTLQALRNKLGRADFFRLLRTWAADPGNQSIADFQQQAEGYHGGSLERFFDVWLYTGRKPAPTVANGVVPPGGSHRLAPQRQAEVVRVVGQLRAASRAIAAAEGAYHGGARP